MAFPSALKRARLNLETIQNIAHGLLWVLMLGLLWKRLYYCVDLTDESLYSALPVSFFRGSRPYLDELLFVQNAGVFLKLLVSLYSIVNPDLSGIVLFFRQCYFLTCLLTTFAAFSFLRKYINKSSSLWGASLVMAFVPFAILSLSYNTLFEHLALLGLLFIITSEKAKFNFPIGALCCLTAGYVYPTILPFIGVILPYVIYNYWKKNSTNIVFILTVGIGVLFLIFVGTVLAYIGVPRLSEMFHYEISPIQNRFYNPVLIPDFDLLSSKDNCRLRALRYHCP